MNNNEKKIASKIASALVPGAATPVSKKAVIDAAIAYGQTAGWAHRIFFSADRRVGRGKYDISDFRMEPSEDADSVEMTYETSAPTAAPAEKFKMVQTAHSVEEQSYVPTSDPLFVRWGPFKDIDSFVASSQFCPVFIAGLSGNGKTFQVEQAAAKNKRKYIRVQINPETDEDDLIGGFRLIDGNTVFAKGPVVRAMEEGALLLLDEIDRGSNKLMCLQSVLEGKSILLKKTGETVYPASGFNIIATANTKGRGSDDGRFTAAAIIDDAFLERFAATIVQPWPTKGAETKIVKRHMEALDCEDEDFANLLVRWAGVIRKTFEDEGVEEVISTRRLCHIVKCFAIFNDRTKAISMTVSRFDKETSEAFMDLYSKIDSGEISGVDDQQEKGEEGKETTAEGNTAT